MMKAKRKPVDHEMIELFVSPAGNDHWTGKLPGPNAKRTDGPLATLQAVQKTIRRHRAKKRIEKPVRVNVRGGTYFLKRPLVFTERDSGRPLDRKGFETPCPVTFAAYRNEKPVISGGRRITGWKTGKLNGKRVWIARIPEVQRGKWNFHQLWVNGKRRPRPRLPAQENFRVERPTGKQKGKGWGPGTDEFIFCKGDLARWKNLQDVEVVIFERWIDPHMWIKDINERKWRVRFDRKSRARLIPNDRGQGTPYVVENVFEALKNPGEWYLDRPTGTIYYMPLPGENIKTAEVIAPHLSELVRLEGKPDSGKEVQEIHFEGMTFSHTEWPFPDGWSSSNQAANEVPGAIVLRNAQRISFRHCALAHLGTYAIECADRTWNIEIVGNDIVDMGAGGVKVWHGCRHTVITDNEIGDGGHIFHAAVGVLIGKSTGNQVLHNHIHNFDYTGISVGWLWGYRESGGYGNVVEYNHIHDIGRGKLSDLGGIYTLGMSPGTRLRYNLIHDVDSRTYGGWGIYPDEGSSYILVENNVVYNTKSGGFHQHYGRENIVRNNIFAYGRETQMTRSRLEEHQSFTFERNIIIFREGNTWHGDWTGRNAVIRNNLYFQEAGKPLSFMKLPGQKKRSTLARWQKFGMDRDSIVANPRFVNASKADFRLKNGSPAEKIGFRPFDLSTAGPRPEMRK